MCSVNKKKKWFSQERFFKMLYSLNKYKELGFKTERNLNTDISYPKRDFSEEKPRLWRIDVLPGPFIMVLKKYIVKLELNRL